MVQRTIDHYVPPQHPKPAPTGHSFLDLPYEIRRRIYLLAGLVRFCPIDLNHEGIPRDDYRRGYLPIGPHRNFNSRGTRLCVYRSKRFWGFIPHLDEEGVECICAPIPYRLL